MVRLVSIALLLAACGTDRAPPGDLVDPDHTGIPCDVADAVAACQSCHGSPPSAPVRLVYQEDFARRVGGITIAEHAVARMRDATKPMPPAPAPRAADPDIATLEAWIAAGLPAGECGGAGPFDTPVTCTSDVRWTLGDEGSPLMRPGGACLACHRTEIDAPDLTIAGTVYPTGHEPNDCFGASGPITVEVTDATNTVYRLPVNSAGNFFLEEIPVQFPITAKVVANGQERVMVTPQNTGDCNTCHTQDGAQLAPGRIVVP